MFEVFEKIAAIGIVPVIAIDDAGKSEALAQALCDGGLPCAEITFRTAQAEESIRRVCKAFPDMLVGAGTVLTVDQADRAVAAGAKFIVSPGLNPTVVKHCLEKKIPVLPGTANASDIELALSLGLEIVKFFPAEINGGIKAIKALAAPYTGVRFMPTGGVSPKNLNDYLAFDRVVACGGSWMASGELIRAGAFEAIRELSAEAVRLMLGFELAHVGINAKDESEAQQVSGRFSELFGFEHKVGNSSIFSGKAVETMKQPYLGAKGHIAIATNSVDRAVNYLRGRGVAFNEESRKTLPNGRLNAIYLAEEIGGFAVHLVQKSK